MRNKLHVTQNRCICFCLKLNSRQHIGAKEFKKINWVPTKKRVEQRIATKIFNYWKGTSPLYVNEFFVPSRNTYGFGDTLIQESISFIEASIWNKLSNNLKVLNTTTSFTQNYKRLVLKTLSE